MTAASEPVGLPELAALVAELEPLSRRERGPRVRALLPAVFALAARERAEWVDTLVDHGMLTRAEVDRAKRTAREAAVETPGTVLDFPRSGAVPSRRVPMSTGTWAYSAGGDGEPARGVYLAVDDGWQPVAPLPYVWERLIRRDGDDRRASVHLRLAMAPPGSEGAEVAIVDREELRTGEWADKLDVPLGADDKVTRATATAIRLEGHGAAVTVQELTPRWADGRLELPPTDVGPRGYGETAGTEDDARRVWREVGSIVGRSPRLALIAGFGLAGPFVAPLRLDSAVVLAVGESSRGKTTALALAASLFGDPAHVVETWNTTSVALTSALGDLGCLPLCVDELGASGLGPAALEALMFRITEGAVRSTGKRTGGRRKSAPWRGIFLSTGNDSILGRVTNEGTAARVVELSTPIVTDPDDAERVKLLTRGDVDQAGVYGWPLRWLQAEPDAVDQVRAEVAAAGVALGMPAGGVERRIARHLTLGIAGAAVLARLIGAPEVHAAALQGARDALDDLSAELRERGVGPADRLLAAVRQALASRPAAFPDVEDQRRTLRQLAGELPTLERPVLPREVEGVRKDDRSVSVFVSRLGPIALAAGIEDTSPGLRQLNKRGRLIAESDSESRLRDKVRLGAAGRVPCYTIRLDDDDPATDPGETTPGRTAPVDGPEPTVDASGPPAGADLPAGPAEGDRDAQGRPVRGPAAACVRCGQPTPYRAGGLPRHLLGLCQPAELAAAVPVDQVAEEVTPAAVSPAPMQKVLGIPRAKQTGRGGVRADDPDPFAVVDAGPDGQAVAVLPDGRRVPGGRLEHFGDVARLGLELGLEHVVHRPSLSSRPLDYRQPGQVVLTAGALAALGAPELWAEGHRSVTAAIDAGWSVRAIDRAERVDRHLYVGREDARVLVWSAPLDGESVDGLGFSVQDAGQLAAELEAFRAATGTAYRLTPGITAEDMARSLTRWDKAVDREPHGELPEEVRGARPADVRWSRELDDQERGRRYVHSLDTQWMHAAPLESVPCGLGRLERYDRPAFDARRTGWWLASIMSDIALLPDPWHPELAGGARAGLGTPDGQAPERWYPTALIELAVQRGYQVEPSAAWLYARSRRYLRPMAERLREARRELEAQTTSGRTAATPGAKLVKELGRILPDRLAYFSAGNSESTNRPLYRPNWGHEIVGRAHAQFARTLFSSAESGLIPFRVEKDAVYFASDNPDPIAVGNSAGLTVDPNRYGKWRVAGSCDMSEWLEGDDGA